jgi:hypothetical protein
MSEHIRQVVGFEIAKAHLMKMNDDGDNFTHRKLTGPLAHALSLRTQRLLPPGQKGVAKRIDMAEEFE